MDDLKQTIQLICGRDPVAPANSRSLVTRHTIEEASNTRQRILLVEDYPTNQQVALRHLRNAGFMVDLAENGREAITAFDRHAYSIILMDMQMPVMDGYEATRTIREKEAAQASHDRTFRPIPIIAMTAHSLEGDREKCLAAGADDYIAKPLKKKGLLSIVGRWVDSSDGYAGDPVAPEGRQGVDEGGDPMDYAQALEEFDDDPEFLMEVLTGFIDNLNAQAHVLRTAIRDGDGDGVARESHAIKGGAANLTANRLAGAAASLEAAGRDGTLVGATQIMDNLETEIRHLETFVESVRLSVSKESI